MFMNLHALPVGQSMYTLAVTNDPTGTPHDQIGYDELDVVASSRANVAGVVAAAKAELDDLYPGARVIGVVNQSDGYVVVENPDGDYR